MRVRVRLGRGVVAWLDANPGLEPVVLARIDQVFASPAKVIATTEPAFGPGFRHMHRSFIVAGCYQVVFEWNPAEPSARLHTCRKLEPPAPAA